MNLLKIAARVALLRPTKVSVDSFTIPGSAVPSLFHAGKTLVESVADNFFEGWYGWGFYAAFDPEFCRKWYGPVVTQFKVKPEAKVLVASVDYACSPPGLLEMIMENDARERPELDELMLIETRARMMENPLQWVHGVDRLAIEYFDIVVYHDENVIIKNPDMIEVVGEFKSS